MICDVCGLPDSYRGQGDGIGSCDCPRCDCGEARGSALCNCPPDDYWYEGCLCDGSCGCNCYDDDGAPWPDDVIVRRPTAPLAVDGRAYRRRCLARRRRR